MSNLKPKVIWEGVVDAYPFEGATVRIVALCDQSGAIAGFNTLKCEIRDVDALGQPSWGSSQTRFDVDDAELEQAVFAAALLSMANKGSE